MAKFFQAMLERFGLTKRILAVNADNATANDSQTTKLASLDNSFESVNRVRCFNHTLQLAAKALLKPFNSESLSASEADDDVDGIRLSLRPSNINCGRTCLLAGPAAPSFYSQPTRTINNSCFSLPRSLGQK
ncbi:uncharacterized protein EDB91DRAFT_1196368 [Suillus paluster]|uniref:uncharacterized protein n=1 Tax=Suillus paluster TaxID=48578 RepID=UPI001B864BAA|nr:uncharacterized protein EDB91DRAFT_1196368 [Suillus paluster]KAG1750336.1 hypothetical protein EDB91DRAFT_1196368 [Suillus paluster]